MLGETYYNTEATIRCIVASMDTFSPPVKYDYKTGSPVLMTPDDSDAAQGWVPGISDGGQHKPLHLSTHQRTRLMGNAINAAFTNTLFRHLHDHEYVPIALPGIKQTSVPSIDQFEDAPALQAHLAKMSASGLRRAVHTHKDSTPVVPGPEIHCRR